MNARDQSLIRDFVENGSEDAFRTLAESYTGLVYSAAYRHLGDRHLAEDAVQSTFILLAKKASKLEPKVMLGSWLYRTVQLVSGHMVRSARRRRRREEAAAMATELTSAVRDEVETVWAFVQPHFDKALASLPAKARDALVARYLEGKSTREIAAEWGVRQNTVAVRVNYAVNKLRRRFAAMGLKVSGTLLLAVLGSKTAEAVPACLAGAAGSTAITAVLSGTGAVGGVGTVADSVASGLIWAKVKLAAVCVGGTVAVTGGVAAVMTHMVPVPDPPTQAKPARVEVPARVDPAQFHPGHYVRVGGKTAPKAAFRRMQASPQIVGLVRAYAWRDLEPVEGRYDFSAIEADLAELQSMGKRLWLEILYAGADPASTPETPGYVRKDPKYGGSSQQHGSYETANHWYLCIWNDHVQLRLARLFAALGKRFNGERYVEGLIIQRTGVGRTSEYGYSVAKLERGFRTKALIVKRAFPDKVILQQMNTGPFDLARHADWLARQGVGLMSIVSELDDKARPVHALHLRHQRQVPTCGLVYWDHYGQVDRTTGRTNTVARILNNVVRRVNPWYVFWGGREPYISKELIPLLRREGPLPNVAALQPRT